MGSQGRILRRQQSFRLARSAFLFHRTRVFPGSSPLPMYIRFPLCLFLSASVAAHAALQTDIEYGTAAGVSLKLDAFVLRGPARFPR